MGQHLTPTQKRLLKTALEKRKVFVRVIRPLGAEAINQYEADQLSALEDMGKLKIIRHYQRGREQTIVAALPSHAGALS